MSLIGILAFLSLTSLFQETTSDRVCNDTIKQYPIVNHFSISTGIDYVTSSVGDEIREDIPKDQKISIHTSVPLNFRYAFSFTDPNIRYYYPGGYQGISVGLLNLGAAEARGISKSIKNIGYPFSLYVFQGAPFLKFHNNLSLNYEWNFGASFGWKPYSEANKYFNLTVGSRVNAYLNLNFCLQWALNPHTSLFAGIAVNHYSNGNTSWPNPGINSLGLRIGATWSVNPIKQGYESPAPDTIIKKKLEYDVTLWGSSRKRVYKGGETPVLLKGHFACAGVSFAPMIRLNTWWRVGGSADIQWDQSSDMKKNYIEGSTSDDIKFTTPSFWRQVTVGLSAHGELQMPIFAVNVGLGYNIIAPWENRGLYQNITLKTYLGSKLFLNVGYQLRNFYQQSSLMLGLGLTL